MDSLPINLFDLIVLMVLLISGVIAFARGVAKEFLKLLAWVGAGYAAIYAFSFVRPLARDVVPVDFLADAVAGVGLFVVALVGLSYLAHIVADHLRPHSLGALDRSLGFVFGLARGAVIVSLAYLFVVWIVKGENLPDWIIEAKSRPLVERGGALIVQLAPRNLRHETIAAAETARLRARQAMEAERKVRELSQPRTEPEKSDAKEGYGDKERKEMDRLIRSKQ
ncbi:MAG: CvpA family protein [Alphaproteobacteria bacterium]|nr:CvpA family protein [Alphaproteobacteria bacterium]